MDVTTGLLSSPVRVSAFSQNVIKRNQTTDATPLAVADDAHAPRASAAEAGMDVDTNPSSTRQQTLVELKTIIGR